MSYTWLKARRWLGARKHYKPPFDALLSSGIPAQTTALREAEFVSLDIETNSLDAASADMLSVGWVVVRDGSVDLSSTETYIVRPSRDVGDSASVHGLTDTVVGAGVDWGIVTDKIVSVLTGRVLLVHHAGLDKVLLDRMCRRRFGSRLLVPVVDTLALAHRRQRRHHHLDDSSSLRLPDLRDTYSLPRYSAHDCLVDAIATAELLLAMAAHHRLTTLGDLLD